MAKRHWIKEAVVEGLKRVDVDELLAETARHVATKGEWETGVISPSLTSVGCRLQRVKKFLGHGYQPGKSWMATKRGEPSAISNFNMLRGFLMEGVLVTALTRVLGARLIGNAPSLVFAWTPDEREAARILEADDRMPSGTLRFAGHPDVLVEDQDGELACIQIKCPSIYKLERVMKKGDEDALQTYRSQMATEMFIGRMKGMPIARNYLLMAGWEMTAKNTEPPMIVVPLEWEDALATIPEEVAFETLWDAHDATTRDVWPEPLKEAAWDVFPCSYCQYPRLGSFDAIACTEHREWIQKAQGLPTRLETMEVAVDQIPANEKVVPIGDLRKARTRQRRATR